MWILLSVIDAEEESHLEVLEDGNNLLEPQIRGSEPEDMNRASESEEDNNTIAGLKMPKRKVKEPAAV